MTLGGRAAEQVVFGRITNGAANDLDRVTAIARSMVFDWGMGRTTQSQQLRADNYALSEETKRMRDSEQREITDEAYAEARAADQPAPRAPRPAGTGVARAGDARPARDRPPARGPRAGVGRVGPDRRRAAGRRRRRRTPTATGRRSAAAGAGVHAPVSRSSPPRSASAVASAGVGVRGDLLGVPTRPSRRRASSSPRSCAARSRPPCRRSGERTSFDDVDERSSGRRHARPARPPGGAGASPAEAASASFSSPFRLRSWICSLAGLGGLLGLVDDGASRRRLPAA